RKETCNENISNFVVFLLLFENNMENKPEQTVVACVGDEYLAREWVGLHAFRTRDVGVGVGDEVFLAQHVGSDGPEQRRAHISDSGTWSERSRGRRSGG